MPRKDSQAGQISAQAQQDLVSEGIENFELPKSLVTKIAKSALPDNAKLQKETVLSLVKGSTVFINYLAATAHDVAQSKQHKSISASDVLKALEMIEFGDLVPPLQHELQVYRDQAKTDKSKKGTTSASNSAVAGGSSSSGTKKASTATSASTTISISMAKLKGSGGDKEKDKEKAPLTSPFTSVPLNKGGGESISGIHGHDAMDVDGDDHEKDDQDEIDDVAEAPVTSENENIDEEDEDVQEDDDDEEEAEDPIAVEEEIIRKDTRGLDEPTVGHNDD